MMNPYWFAVAIAVQVVLVFCCWIKRKKRIAIRNMAVLLAFASLGEGVCLGWTETTYSLDSNINRDTVITVRHARKYPGPILEVDVAPEVFVGWLFSPWLRSIGTYGGNDYEWGMEHTEPSKLCWETSKKCWIERFGDRKDRGVFAEKDERGSWTLKYAHRGDN